MGDLIRGVNTTSSVGVEREVIDTPEHSPVSAVVGKPVIQGGRSDAVSAPTNKAITSRSVSRPSNWYGWGGIGASVLAGAGSLMLGTTASLVAGGLFLGAAVTGIGVLALQSSKDDAQLSGESGSGDLSQLRPMVPVSDLSVQRVAETAVNTVSVDELQRELDASRLSEKEESYVIENQQKLQDVLLAPMDTMDDEGFGDAEDADSSMSVEGLLQLEGELLILKDQVESLDADNKKLRTALQEQQSQAGTRNEQLTEAVSLNQQMAQRSQEFEDENLLIQEKLASLEARAALSEQAVKQLESEKQLLEQQVRTEQDQSIKMIDESERREEERLRLSSRNKVLTSENSTLQGEVSSLKTEKEQLVDQLTTLKQEKNEAITMQKAATSRAEEQHTNAADDYESYEREMKARDQQIVQQKRALAEKDTAYSDLQADFRELEKNYQALKDEQEMVIEGAKAWKNQQEQVMPSDDGSYQEHAGYWRELLNELGEPDNLTPELLVPGINNLREDAARWIKVYDTMRKYSSKMTEDEVIAMFTNVVKGLEHARSRDS